MADLSNLESILATLAAQKTAPGAAPAPGAPSSGAPGYSYPQPTTSGNLDLGAAAQPTTSGSVSIQEAIARAKAHAAQNGVTSYDRPITYAPQPSAPADSQSQSDRRYRTSRSRSPPPARRADNYREGSHNPYRDERREDFRRDYPQDRQERPYSPAHRGSGRPDRGDRGDRDRSGAFSPRGGRRDRSPPRGSAGPDGDNFEIIMIKAGLVGLIIGRQGENLRRVEADSQCRVQFLAPANPEDELRQCKITGAPARRAEAKAAIYKIIDDSSVPGGGPPRGPGGRSFGGHGGPGGPGGPGGYGGSTPGGGPPQATLKEGEECIQIMVPDRTVGLIIGRGGETIRDLQERSGCHINIVGETKSVNGLRPVNLIGGREATTQAKELIMEIVDSDTRNGAGGPPGAGGPGGAPFRGGGHQGGGGGYQGGGGGYQGGGGGGGGDRVNDSIFVPAEAVGMIIGKGGETIREMQSTTGCKINVSQTPGANENEREIGLIGSAESIERAKISIEEKVETVRQKNSGGYNAGGHGGGGHGGYGGQGGGRGGRGGFRGEGRGDDNGYRQRNDYDSGNSGYGGRDGGRGGPGGPGGAGPNPGMPAQSGGDDPSADPYAAYGGYAAYVAMWYQALAQQQGAGGGAPPPAPGQ